MKGLAILCSITIIALCPFALGSAINRRGSSLSCQDTGGEFGALFGDQQCIGRPNELLIPDYWYWESKRINESRWYGDYDKIICSLTHVHNVCAFLEGTSGQKVPGSQIKKLIKHLGSWCDRSRCGQCNVNEVEGPATQGVFKIDGVEQMGWCRGLCSPTECVLPQLRLLFLYRYSQFS